MRVDTCVSSGASQVFALSKWDVLAIGVLVALGETEIDDEDVIFVCVISADQEVVGLDISVNDALLVYLLNTLNLFQMIYSKVELVNTI